MTTGVDVYTVQDWQLQVSQSVIPTWKRLAYQILRPHWNRKSASSVEHDGFDLGIDAKYISERGYDIKFRRKWAAEGIDLKNATIVVQGTGTGWDVVSWAELLPKRILAVDLFEFDSWPSIVDFCKREFNVSVEFVASPLEKDFGLSSNSVDLVVSDAVYEHCRDLYSVMEETRRFLKKGGRVYGNYGPLWYCAGGDHFSGNNDLKDSYNHITLNKADYGEYVKKFRSNVGGFQEGARYIELDLFSKLSTKEYLEVYRSLGFRINDLWLEVSKRAVDFMNKFDGPFQAVQAKLPPRVGVNDLLIKAHHIRLSKG